MKKFEEYFDDLKNCYEQLYHIVLMHQKEFCEYVLSLTIGHKNVMGIIIFIKELYENEQVEFEQLYHWVLNQMFCREFYDYSFSYQFVDCLLLLEEANQVFIDIVNKMDVDNSLSIQIAISSMYLHDEMFIDYPWIGCVFLEKVISAIKKEKTVRKEARLFLKPIFQIKSYKKFKLRFVLTYLMIM